MSANEKDMTGTILRIQRMSTEDGPGIRSTVFFKGCPLACVWCHNPESISSRMQTHWEKTRCIGCWSCIEACIKGALAATETGIAIDRSKCDSCDACAKACPSTAMEIYGEACGPNDLVREVLKDEAYFQKSGGGVTLSGGEPTMQPLFAKELLSTFKQGGIHTALDTCGQCPWETLDALLPHTDLVLYDLKEINPDKHKDLPFGDDARLALVAAAREARGLSSRQIGAEHLLLGLLHSDTSLAALILRERGLRLEPLRAAIGGWTQ